MSDFCPICHEPSHLTGCGADAIEDLVEKDYYAWQRAIQERDSLRAQLATARAIAMEEAARLERRVHRVAVGHLSETTAPLHAHAAMVRAVALPPSILPVPRETVEKVREALEKYKSATFDRLYANGPLSTEYAHAVSRAVNDALALLEAAGNK